jgi:gliding motility-associated-like protein
MTRLKRTIYSFTLRVLLLWVVVISAQAQALPTWTWTTQAGGPDWTLPHSMTADKQGNIIVVGEFFGPTSFGSTTFTSTPTAIPFPFAHSDIFVAKYTATGRLRWVRMAGGAGHDFPSHVVADSNGDVYVTGRFGSNGTTLGQTATFGSVTITSRGTGEAFLAKYDSTGLLHWVRQVDRSVNNSFAFSEGMHLAVDSRHNIYWTGIYSGSVTIAGAAPSGPGDQHIYLAKLNSAGAIRWLRSGMCRGEYGVAATCLAIDNQDHLYFAGNMASTAAFGSYIFNNLGGGYTNDVFVAKYDTLGAVQWAKQLGGTLRDNLADMAAMLNGNVLLGINFTGSPSFISQSLSSPGVQNMALACLTAAGQLAWLRQEGGSSGGTGLKLAVDRQNTCYVLSSFTDLPNFTAPPTTGSGYYNYLLSYDATGTRKWVMPEPRYDYGWTGGSMTHVVSLAPAKVVVAGNFKGTATFPGLTPIRSSSPATTTFPGQVNLWVAELSGIAPSIPTDNPTTDIAERVLIPNIITPNGDRYNEYFVLKGLNASAYALTIYSRWGKQVYYTASYQQDWNAPNLPSGLYYYHLQAAGKASLKGWVEVQRQ